MRSCRSASKAVAVYKNDCANAGWSEVRRGGGSSLGGLNFIPQCYFPSDGQSPVAWSREKTSWARVKSHCSSTDKVTGSKLCIHKSMPHTHNARHALSTYFMRTATVTESYRQKFDHWGQRIYLVINCMYSHSLKKLIALLASYFVVILIWTFQRFSSLSIFK